MTKKPVEPEYPRSGDDHAGWERWQDYLARLDAWKTQHRSDGHDECETCDV